VPRGNGAPIGGVKTVTWNGWFAARPSGTEAVYKIYAETCKDEQHLQTIVTEAQHSEQYSRRRGVIRGRIAPSALAHSEGTGKGRGAPAGVKFPVFPVETGNFIDFPRATAVWAAKTGGKSSSYKKIPVAT